MNLSSTVTCNTRLSVTSILRDLVSTAQHGRGQGVALERLGVRLLWATWHNGLMLVGAWATLCPATAAGERLSSLNPNLT